MDFSCAFDTVRHSTLMPKILSMDIPDNIFNWLVNYFADRGHVTKLWDIISQVAFINASIVQGSVIGPTSYVIVASGLHPIHQHNKMMKYADDMYLMVGSSMVGIYNGSGSGSYRKADVEAATGWLPTTRTPVI